MQDDGRVIAPAAKEDGPHVATFSELAEWHKIERADAERILREAVRLIRRNGWTQKHGAARDDGSRCDCDAPDVARFSIIGAIMRAEIDLELKWMHGLAAVAIVRETIGMEPLAFNEMRGRKEPEILDALYRALYRALAHYGEAA